MIWRLDRLAVMRPVRVGSSIAPRGVAGPPGVANFFVGRTFREAVLRRRMAQSRYLLLGMAAFLCAAARGQLAVNTLPADLQQKVDQVAEAALKDTGVPSASLAVVRDGQIVYTHAYGQARLGPAEAGAPAMGSPS